MLRILFCVWLSDKQLYCKIIVLYEYLGFKTQLIANADKVYFL